jgi:hypothetical protein
MLTLGFVGDDFRSVQILRILGANAKISLGAWAKEVIGILGPVLESMLVK